MKIKYILLLALLLLIINIYSQEPEPPGGDPEGESPVGLGMSGLISEANVSITLDLQPVLQLQLTTPDEINFIFDDVASYYSGKIKYATTVLKVSSSVTWDLYAVGHSQNGIYWDQQIAYGGGVGGSSATPSLPISLLELRQYGENRYTEAATGAWADYSNQFIPVQQAYDAWGLGSFPAGQNSIYVATANQIYQMPDENQKYIQGHSGTSINNGAPGGSWMLQSIYNSEDEFSHYYFTIDYRIVPGLPATFPMAGDNSVKSITFNTDAGADGYQDIRVATDNNNAYAQPGVYTMNVKYILLEDQ